MTRHSFGWLVLALTGLVACAPKSKPYGPPQDADTSGLTPSGGGGAGAGGSTGGGTGGLGGAPGIDCNSPGVDPECLEDMAITPPGTFGPVPSHCTCQDEAAHLLKIIACDGKTHFDTFMDSCGSAITVPVVPPAQTYYVPVTGSGTDFDTGSSDVGWLCLGVTMPHIVHCQFSYTRGGSPITKSLGGPEVTGPNSFEVVAQGDRDGDGILATFAILGDPDAGGGNKLVLGPILEFNGLE